MLFCVGSVFILILSALTVFFLTCDNEPIKNSTGGISADGTPADAKNDVAFGNLSFSENRINIKVGESYNAEVINETGANGAYIWESSNISVAFVENGTITGVSEGSCDITVKISETQHTAQLRVIVEHDTTENEHDIVTENGMTYIDGILIANKTYSLPADYDPGMSEEALAAFAEMQADAEEEGLYLENSSDYRSYYDQESIYNRYVESDGIELADTYSSRPGHSDHQTGLAIDLNSIDDSFGDTPESDWVAENAHKYGFIIRFPKGKDKYTGYQYEPWHIRYLGIDKATEVYESGLSLEEFLGITSEYED
ncbi:MAG: D-alanyl-D-alanine carboxypeptidase family protein [Clostridium sp.]|nr:D-alanyl-D-alanine carboxypeptidase family protein [Clostridium sp.]MCM1547722.1 D-alanyl-D-alanine carboxypeptidase family protein [Ruminococcus sp.]